MPLTAALPVIAAVVVLGRCSEDLSGIRRRDRSLGSLLCGIGVGLRVGGCRFLGVGEAMLLVVLGLRARLTVVPLLVGRGLRGLRTFV